MTTENWVIAKGLEDLVQDRSPLHLRPEVVQKLELEHRPKKNLMKVSITALRSLVLELTAMKELRSDSVTMPSK
jgi:hypothetical protein